MKKFLIEFILFLLLVWIISHLPDNNMQRFEIAHWFVPILLASLIWVVWLRVTEEFMPKRAWFVVFLYLGSIAVLTITT
jgi:glycerol uptake facilitator-like aquaporin